MKQSSWIRVLACAPLIVASVAQAADIFKWVDAQGKTHIADQVPERYRAQAVRLQPDTVEPTPGAVAAARQRAARMETEANAAAPVVAPPPVTAPTATTAPPPASTCAQQQLAYRQSQACYSRFQIVNGALKPGAAETCGPPLVDPAAHCSQ